MSVLTILAAQALAAGVALTGAAAPAPAAPSAAEVGATATLNAAANIGASGALAAGGAESSKKPLCESTRPQYGDTMQVQCALRASAAPIRFRFEVRFLGGHDDTRASLTATLNGQPLTCDEGSKPQLEGEFGEVSIHCQFSSRDAQELKVDVVWYHAQYSEFVLEPV